MTECCSQYKECRRLEESHYHDFCCWLWIHFECGFPFCFLLSLFSLFSVNAIAIDRNESHQYWNDVWNYLRWSNVTNAPESTFRRQRNAFDHSQFQTNFILCDYLYIIAEVSSELAQTNVSWLWIFGIFETCFHCMFNRSLLLIAIIHLQIN